MLIAAANGAPEGSWLRAERQLAGRGRVGRTWISPTGNLYASTIVWLRSGDPEAATLALVAAVALHEVAAAYAGSGAITLKWPNDLMAGPAKLAGILLERAGDAVIVGFGINLMHHPEQLDRPTTSLAVLSGGAPEPATFLVDLSTAFARWLARWRGEGLTAVRARWMASAHPLGAPLIAGDAEGLFAGLDGDGALLLRRADGRIETIRAGDVFLAN